MSSRRRERRAEHAIKRAGKAGEINIVSLIDIFAILVFYLLVNALVVEVIPQYQNLKLPNSIAKEKPVKAVNVVVSTSDIFVNEQSIMPLADALASTQAALPELSEALVPLAELGEEENLSRNEINIVADESIPYHLLKKVLAACTEAHFERISLAVKQAPTSATTGADV
jgi:biopolymer transport protein TolR